MKEQSNINKGGHMRHVIANSLRFISVFVLAISSTILVYATDEQNFTAYNAPTAYASPSDMTLGADGNIWFTERLARNIGRVTPSGTITEFPTPEEGYPENFPVALTAASDDALWFTNVLGQNINRMALDGTVTQFPLPYGSVTWSDIVAGPDGALWFSNWFAGTNYSIGRVTTDGTLTAFPTHQVYSDVAKMVFGPDGALWMTRASSGGSYVTRMTTTGEITDYPLPAGSNPRGINVGSDGALWFTLSGTHAIGRMTTAGVLTQYPLTDSLTTPLDIVAGADGMLWISGQNPSVLLNMSTDGSVRTTYSVPYTSNPQTLTNGPDGKLWFTAPGANKVGWFDVPLLGPTSVTLTPSGGVGTVDATATIEATVLNALDEPVADVTVRFAVSGSTLLADSCETNTQGVCTFSYTGPQLPGADMIEVYVDANENSVKEPAEPSATATYAWLLPTTTTGQVTGGGHIMNASTENDIAFGFTTKSNANGITGNCTLVDPAAAVKLHCTNATIVVSSGTSATIFGNALLDGETTLYRIDVQDISTPGTGADVFSLATESGYRASGTLTAGNLKIHD